MLIHGLQKMTLLDFPGHVACTVFLGGCDLRCPFCHNYELADGSAPSVMDDQELLKFLSKRRGLLDGVAITGGEPCLRPDLPDLLREIRALGFKTKLDTNGFHPELLSRLLSEGLVDYTAVDIKNSAAKYAVTCGLQELDLRPLNETVSLLVGGDYDYEFRTTVVKEFHEASDFEEIGQLILGAKRYFLQCFTDRDSVPFEGLHAPTADDLKAYADIARKYVPETGIRGVDL
ncbi:MAG: anaerobic ribonucleoside-triphosphate reductase activating protein [Lachnospiraceae bacterium]|nr:anaerobic ribonucleoside-triphosphate reductase activating protein [Lachnospiraceae bacterium]